MKIPEGRCYIAAPFFNEIQIRTIATVEELFNRLEVSYYSPRLEGGIITPDAPASAWDNAFNSDIYGAETCGWMLAVLEYPHPEYVKLELVNLELPTSKEVHMTDLGTTWEMGLMYGLGKPVVGFVTDLAYVRKINLMLARGCSDVICGFSELNDYVNGVRIEARQLREGLH